MEKMFIIRMCLQIPELVSEFVIKNVFCQGGARPPTASQLCQPLRGLERRRQGNNRQILSS